MPDLTSNTAGIRSPNPFWLASAPPANSGAQIQRAFDHGWGGAVWKTLGTPIQNVSSRFGAIAYGGHRGVGFNNIELITDRPLEVNFREIYETKKKYPDHAIIVSLMVETREEWKEIIQRSEDAGADGLELNFGCPHGMCERGMGSAVGQEPAVNTRITGWAKEFANVPVLVKLTPNVGDILPHGQAAKAGAKAAGAVIDDAAVTPKYVAGFSPAREIPIVWRIAKGSIKNKLIFLLPVGLLLNEFAPWTITPLLMLGGAYLCFEGAEKVHHLFAHKESHADLPLEEAVDAVHLEEQKVSGAIKTDFILSAEIMTIALSEIPESNIWMEAATLATVAVGITAAVYGAVAVIVKLDDIGLHLTQKSGAAARALGAFLLRSVPHLLTMLTIVGTIAMLWVGGGIIVHGTHEVGFHAIYDAIHGAEQAVASASGAAGGVLGWLTYAALSAVLGVVLGAAIAIVLHKLLGVGSGHGH